MTTDGVRVEVGFVRVDYDVNKAIEGIRASALPDDFAESLRTASSLASASSEKA